MQNNLVSEMPIPGRKAITPRGLSAQESSWIREILASNPAWAHVDLSNTQVVAECACGKCKSVYLDSPVSEQPGLQGTKGYIGRIEIRTSDEFLITISLDQHDGKLSELYVDPLDLREPGERLLLEPWLEKSHTVTAM
jgi:hypothetical protein